MQPNAMCEQLELDLADVEMVEESEEQKERNREVELERLSRLHSKQEMDEYKEAFSIFDRDGSGTITVTEMGTVMRALGQHPTQSDLYEMIGKIDRNRNGMIDFPEFIILMDQKKTSTIRHNPEYLKTCFEVFDKNGDGFITSEELRNIMTNLGEKLTNEEVDEMIKVADIDEDGKLNYKEFIYLMCTD
ncbi:neo-calmodulin-like [Lineus longissimus]|uniref:neo-calmodulin-like n=1 Tax=Lineus longissimus TaxID=88925 RepID=UPI002B4D4707